MPNRRHRVLNVVDTDTGGGELLRKTADDLVGPLAGVATGFGPLRAEEKRDQVAEERLVGFDRQAALLLDGDGGVERLAGARRRGVAGRKDIADEVAAHEIGLARVAGARHEALPRADVVDAQLFVSVVAVRGERMTRGLAMPALFEEIE